MASEKKVGTVTHYFGEPEVAIVKLSAPLAVGDTVHIVGGEHDFEQEVKSMQIDHTDIEKAKKGDEVGVKVKEKAPDGSEVFKVS